MNERKVLSVQLGPYANYVSAHFWNSIIEAKEDEGSYFYESKPVALCVDVKDAQMGLLNANVNVTLEDVPWGGETAVVDRRSQLPQNNWSSVLRSDYYDRNHSFHKLEDVRRGITPFDVVSDGFLAPQGAEDLTDSLRHWSECCDSLGAVRLLWDLNSGFGGVTKSVLEYVNDEHQKSDIFAFPIEINEDTKHSNVNNTLSLYHLYPATKMYVPLSSSSWNAAQHAKNLQIPNLSVVNVTKAKATFLESWRCFEERYSFLLQSALINPFFLKYSSFF